jgi:hypothetical protein
MKLGFDDIPSAIPNSPGQYEIFTIQGVPLKVGIAELLLPNNPAYTYSAALLPLAFCIRPREPIVLELRPNCECCDRNLPAESGEAMICSFECTFCAKCVEEILGGVCPNCGGNLVARPIRPKHLLVKFPASTSRVSKSGGCEAGAERRAPSRAWGAGLGGK